MRMEVSEGLDAKSFIVGRLRPQKIAFTTLENPRFAQLHAKTD